MGAQVAIIVPAYHAHDTIKDLLKTIVSQTKVDVCKTIVIDDADEQSYDYLYEDFPSLDLMILRNEENKGPSTARNKGLEKAIALGIPYVMFADADDLFYSNLAVEILLYTRGNNDADLVCSGFFEEQEETLVLHNDYDIWLFGKIYKTSLIKEYNIRFPEMSVNEDVCFNLHYWLVSGTKNIVEEALYLWKNNPNSITRKNNAAYTWESYTPLCHNLIVTYQKIIEDKRISEEKILGSFANRLIRMYMGYNEFSITDEPRIDLKGMMTALRCWNQEILEPYWDKLTPELIYGAWNEISSEPGHTFIPNIGLTEFFKEMREEP